MQPHRRASRLPESQTKGLLVKDEESGEKFLVFQSTLIIAQKAGNMEYLFGRPPAGTF
jgi:hypothetical protein